MRASPPPPRRSHFYSRPYARGDAALLRSCANVIYISTRAPTRGATKYRRYSRSRNVYFYSRPYARGDARAEQGARGGRDFYSRPYARGDGHEERATKPPAQFLLAPLREGRHARAEQGARGGRDFYSRPYARGDSNFSQNHKLIYMINC